jgi:pSer/pThr/pTyr-binding forkhead associated (FHA) protein
MSKLTFGRSRDCNIVLSDNSVSRIHGYLLTAGNKVYLVDENSTNGTFVNGRRIQNKIALHPGDRVMIGGKVPLNWQQYACVESAEVVPESTSYSTVSKYESHVPRSNPKAFVDIPSKIDVNKNVNYNYAEVYRNGEEGADWKVPLKRNIGDRVGGAVGTTLGCLISIIIVIIVFLIIGAFAH